MGLESATLINDLVATNPTSTDFRSQGDDHLRLIKAVLQATFPNATRAFPIPNALTKTVDYSVVENDGESTLYGSTGGGAVTFTLPSLAASKAGWKVHFCKITSDANPMYIKAAAGNVTSGLYSVAKARRAIPGSTCTAIWDGTGWYVTRCLALPLGAMVDYFSATLPPGYEWPNGQTLASASTAYPEFYQANGSSGVVLDLRGRVAVTLDNLGGSAAGRLAGGIITGTAVGNTGGSDTRSLATTNLPAQTPSGTVAVTTIGIKTRGGAISGTTNDSNSVLEGISSLTLSNPNNGPIVQPTASFTGTAFAGQNATAFGILQPSIMCAKVLVVE